MKTYSPRTRGRRALSNVLARASCTLFHDAMQDWLNSSHFEAVRFHVEEMLQDELDLVERRVRGELRNAWHDEHQSEFNFHSDDEAGR